MTRRIGENVSDPIWGVGNGHANVFLIRENDEAAISAVEEIATRSNLKAGSVIRGIVKAYVELVATGELPNQVEMTSRSGEIIQVTLQVPELTMNPSPGV